MQIKKLAPTLSGQWAAIYRRERPNLVPNAISGDALCAYIRETLRAEELIDETSLEAVKKDVENSTFYAQKLNGAEPQPAAFRLPDGSFVGVDLVSGWFFAENDAVREELTYVKGLDAQDLENPILTVNWLNCKKSLEARRKKKLPPLPKKLSFVHARQDRNREEER